MLSREIINTPAFWKTKSLFTQTPKPSNDHVIDLLLLRYQIFARSSELDHRIAA